MEQLAFAADHQPGAGCKSGHRQLSTKLRAVKWPELPATPGISKLQQLHALSAPGESRLLSFHVTTGLRVVSIGVN